MAASRAAKFTAALAVGLGLLSGSAPAATLYRPEVSSKDPRDLSGVWFLRRYNRVIPTLEGTPPPMTERAKLEWAKRVVAEANGAPIADASSHCWPHGTPRVMNSPYPLQIFQTANQVIIAHEVAHNTRYVHMQRGHLTPAKVSFMGDSVGHWEGDTLVFDTIGLQGWPKKIFDRTGAIHSDELHTVTRMRRVDANTFEADIVLEDPVAFTKPWHIVKRYRRLPYGTRLYDYSCAENNRNEISPSGKTLTKDTSGKIIDKDKR